VLKEAINEHQDSEEIFSYIERITRATKELLAELDNKAVEKPTGSGSLEIHTQLRGARQPKSCYDQQTLKQIAISEINTYKTDNIYFTDGSILDGKVGYGVYCKLQERKNRKTI
jgi:hypothetical protein